MKWGKPTKYAQVSSDGRYSVAKVAVRGEWRYEAWRTAQHPAGRLPIAKHLTSPETARIACEEHHAQP
jgi:IS5 family transposase